MRMTIDESVLYMELYKRELFDSVSDLDKDIEAYDIAISIMRKYQKIEQILNDWENSGEKDDPINIIDNIEEVIEDENDD